MRLATETLFHLKSLVGGTMSVYGAADTSILGNAKESCMLAVLQGESSVKYESQTKG